MSTLFIWGSGGVGKSHLAIRRVAKAAAPSLLITLDPSQRVFDLVSAPREAFEADIQIQNYAFKIKRADQNKLFANLESRKPASEKVRIFYEQMVKGLQDFRDYLTLIQLSDELQAAEFKNLVIDTPPFEEAMGLHRSLFNLRHFFEKSLVQLALKSANISWLHTTLKRVFEVARIFSGKKSAEQIFDFIEWLTFHTERFSSSAKYLEELVFSKDTRHLFVLTPETPIGFLDSVKAFFGEFGGIEFVINRSVAAYELPDASDLFLDEIKSFKIQEDTLTTAIKKKFSRAKIERIPFTLMGEDTEEELIKFISL